MRRIVLLVCSTIAASGTLLAVTSSTAAQADNHVEREVCATVDIRSNVYDPTPSGPVHDCVDEMIANQCLGATTGLDPAFVVTFEVCFPLPH